MNSIIIHFLWQIWVYSISIFKMGVFSKNNVRLFVFVTFLSRWHPRARVLADENVMNTYTYINTCEYETKHHHLFICKYFLLTYSKYVGNNFDLSIKGKLSWAHACAWYFSNTSPTLKLLWRRQTNFRTLCDACQRVDTLGALACFRLSRTEDM